MDTESEGERVEETEEHGSDRNNNSKGNEEEDSNEEEMKSMMKFAKFLEMNGYLSKDKKSGDKIDDNSTQKEPHKGNESIVKRRKNEKLNLSPPLSNLSEETIYRRAVPLVPLVMNNSIENDDPEIAFKNKNSSPSRNKTVDLMRMSSSSEKEEQSGQSGDEAVVIAATLTAEQIKLKESTTEELIKEQILFKQF